MPRRARRACARAADDSQSRAAAQGSAVRRGGCARRAVVTAQDRDQGSDEDQGQGADQAAIEGPAQGARQATPRPRGQTALGGAPPRRLTVGANVERAIPSGTDGAELDPKGPAERRLARRLGLRRIAVDALTIRRVRRGRGFAYVDADGTCIRDRHITRRLARLAVPPAYEDVLYARDPAAHLQAVG